MNPRPHSQPRLLPQMQRLEQRTFLSVSPIGKYSGTLIPLTSTQKYPLKLTISKKTATKDVFSAVLTVPGFGAEKFVYNMTPATDGSFTIDLGKVSSQGIIYGHFSGGKLVVVFSVPGNAPARASMKRV